MIDTNSNLVRLRRILEPGIAVVTRLWLPFVLIQFTGLVVVLAYFYVPSFARACDSVGMLKERLGLLFAAVTMPIAGGLVPELFKTITGVDRSITRERAARTLHNMVLFSVAGVCVDLFYLLLGDWFAGVPPMVAIPSKVLIDQLIYTPIIGVPIIAVSYTLRSTGYRPIAMLKQFSPAWYEREVLPVLVVGWAYWFPMTILMYTLPTALTFIYGLVANAASATLLTAVAARHRADRAHDGS